MSLQLTDEQKSMVATIREFAAKECGTREQRLALTDGGKTHHNAEIARKLADLGFPGPVHPGGVRRRRRRALRRLPVPRGDWPTTGSRWAASASL